MTPYEQRMHERFLLLPEQIVLLTRDNAIVNAAARAWLDSDQPLDWLLIGLVVTMAKEIGDLETRMKEQLFRTDRWTM